MYELTELGSVEETKHLLPNLRVMIRALFGDNAYSTSKAPSQADWATDKRRIGDALLWLPWLRQLWLIELEWKRESNFFDQSRAFAEGRVNEDKLRLQLKEILEKFGDVLVRYSSDLSSDVIANRIIDQTLRIHISRGHLCPHGWVILGHTGNRDELREAYEKELKSRFTGNKHYILSMARMFVGHSSSYILLEQYSSTGCSKLIDLCPSILIPAAYPALEESIPKVETKIPRYPARGRAAQIWDYLHRINPELTRENVRLRIRTDERHVSEYQIDWEHPGYELMVITKEGIHQKPTNAFKKEFPDLKQRKITNISRKFGTFLDVLRIPAVELAKYSDVERHLWLRSQKPDTLIRAKIELGDQETRTYFTFITVHKQKKIRDNILNRKELWEVFLEKKKMTSAEFKRLSRFTPKGIAGFMHFLTRNEIASRVGDIFTLNEAVIPHIRKQLREGGN